MKLHHKILLGLAAGAFVGAAANILLPGNPAVTWAAENVAKPVGDVFLRMLLMTVIPLVVSSITLGVAGLGDVRRLGRVGAKTLAYFALSTALSATVGLVLVNLIRPGDGLDPAVRERLFAEYRGEAAQMQSGMATSGSWVSLLVNIVPRNPVQAAANLDMLGVIFFAIVFGAALTLIPEEKARPMIRVLDAIGEAIVKVIDFAMAIAPYGVFGLIFFTVYRFGWEILIDLAKYVAVVLAGLALYASVGLSALVRIFGKLNPRIFWKKAWTSAITAFSTSSSNATLP
ncbi:MAG: dicarboxylate/amino acid:cation symporter, partial [Gemmatimonadales bacterium]